MWPENCWSRNSVLPGYTTVEDRIPPPGFEPGLLAPEAKDGSNLTATG